MPSKYYYKMSDMDKMIPFKHLNRGALLWMVVRKIRKRERWSKEILNFEIQIQIEIENVELDR